ncbi:hypothetical protein BV22DRAFT_841402 [Leucogyrophana mollusca]|uniref:Uncharacterized protein n=1 Tax=Leucogyrophana mollusca TaxID=85980 RepID=A0ACB8B2G3_9AGAM|nr:hypothetical protein BV22DRAFT_841402 [Leucogyrophana mollusca]
MGSPFLLSYASLPRSKAPSRCLPHQSCNQLPKLVEINRSLGADVHCRLRTDVLENQELPSDFCATPVASQPHHRLCGVFAIPTFAGRSHCTGILESKRCRPSVIAFDCCPSLSHSHWRWHNHNAITRRTKGQPADVMLDLFSRPSASTCCILGRG